MSGQTRMCKSSCAADSNYDSLITRDGFTRAQAFGAHGNYTSVDAMLLVLIRHGSRDRKKVTWSKSSSTWVVVCVFTWVVEGETVT